MSTVSEHHADARTIEDGLSEYRELCWLAIAGAILGAVSILALNHPAFWILPLVATYVNWRALRSIHEQPEALKGRATALVGLGLALIFAISAPVLSLGQRSANRRQAIDVARGWFEALRDNRPDVAHQWTMPRWMRVHEGEYLPSHYANVSGKRAMERFLVQPTVRILLKVGKRSHVRYYGNVSREMLDETIKIVDVYAVTVGEGADRVSFFIQLTITARLDAVSKQWSWELTNSEFLRKLPPSQLFNDAHTVR
ncbi:MAG TPA: hypothetical protein VFI31_16345 [Pirellulales bacterium]|nr:hypothetical protein [Pirellulales bacterium]